MPVAHVPRDDKEHGGKCCHGDQGSRRHQYQQDEQQRNAVHDSGDRCASAVLYVGGGTGDGAGSRDPAEKTGKDIKRRGSCPSSPKSVTIP